MDRSIGWSLSFEGAGVPGEKAILVIDSLCYGLLAAAWIVDLITPQTLVVSILFNGPIAFSLVTLRRNLTISLAALAEIGNAIAGYVNGVQAGRHWDVIALGDRFLLAASFVLVAVLTIRAQENARRAGEMSERERAIERERALRHAMEHVRASLNMELVLRSAVSEASLLTGADLVTIGVRQTSFDVPERYELAHGAPDVVVHREAYSPQVASLVERAREAKRVVAIDGSEPLGRLFGTTALVGVIDLEGAELSIVLSWESRTPGADERAAVQDFVDNLSVALQQARLFIRLAEQNEEIAEKKDELQASSDVIRDIVYALADDLRTPLAAADTTMNQAMTGAYGDLPERYRAVLRSSIASNIDSRRLVDTLLLVARYEAGEDSHAFAPHELAPIVTRVIEEMRPVADEKRVSLAADIQHSSRPLNVDGDEIRRAITNLVANALAATPEGGHVNVELRNDVGHALIVVDDDGYGVSEDRRASLFQRFGGRRGGEGTGLGLYIVRRIAEKYGGEVRFEPRDPRDPRGSRFTIELPIKEENA